MFKISTERLNIFPLDKSLLELCISNFSDIESAFGLEVTRRKLSDKEKNVYKLRLKIAQRSKCKKQLQI